MPRSFYLGQHKILITPVDAGFLISESTPFNCKQFHTTTNLFPQEAFARAAGQLAIPATPVKPKFLIIHGNVSYDFSYRSRIDTPYAQDNLQQHVERVWLSVLVKEKYPFKVAFTARQDNAPFFRNFIDANFQFDKYSYQNNIKQQLIAKLQSMPVTEELRAVQAAISAQEAKLNKLKQQLAERSNAQKMIEQRERAYRDAFEIKPNVPAVDDSMATAALSNFDSSRKVVHRYYEDKKAGADSLVQRMQHKYDSSVGKILAGYESEKRQLDSAARQLAVLQKKGDSLKQQYQGDLTKKRQAISQAGSAAEIKKLAAANGISTGKESKFDKHLMAIQSFSIGKSLVNYTELTAQNILVSGVNVEYNRNNIYAAFAAGRINYRFRDFYNHHEKHNDQYLLLARLRVGNIEKRALIFTLFKGRKSQSGYAVSDSVNNNVGITGYAVEAIFKRNENTFFSAEFAKSTKPAIGVSPHSDNNKPLWKFSDESNMGINIKAQTFIPGTNTRLSGYFRKTGENFQSFSLFSYNTNQTAWQTRLDQTFLKNKVSFTGMLRQNDFSNPFTLKTYKTTTLFKTLLLNIRLPKYPALSVGYYPGTQLYFIDKERIRENAYYIINGSLVYNYRFKRTAMNSAIIYNRYINQATDSGFNLYKGINYYASQMVMLRKLQLQAGYAYNYQPELIYHTLEGSGNYALKEWLKLGTGLKFNRVAGGQKYWGERMSLAVELKHFGSIQVQYEKSYLPTISNTLYPVEIGRLSWYKYF